MELTPSAEEADIMAAAQAYLREALPLARLHGSAQADLAAATRAQIAQLGWFALALPEEQGGSGLSAVEHVLFFRELGRQCGPLDVLAQCLAVLMQAGGPAGEGIASGAAGVALAVPDGGGLRVLGAADARFALLAEPAGAHLLSLEGARLEPRPALDPANSMHRTSGLAAVAERNDPALWHLGQLGAAAMLVGIAEAALDLIVEYAKVRETFGRKIGSYQAVRHPLADMAVRNEAARCELFFAAAAVKAARPDAAAHVAAAKHLAGEAALRSADSNIQLHGGIGVTEEHDAHLLLKRALVLTRVFGERRAVLEHLLHARSEG